MTYKCHANPDKPMPLFDRPLAHHNDPITSIEAGENNERPGRAARQRRLIYDFLKANADRDWTPAEIEFASGDISYHDVHRRMKEAMTIYPIVVSQVRFCARLKKKCQAYKIK